MIEVAALWLLRPWWLAALAPLALAAWAARRRTAGSAGWGRVLDPALTPTLERLGHLAPGRNGGIVTALAALGSVLALALAGPASRDETAPAFRNLDVVFLLVDLSRSTTTGGRLDDLQAAAARLLAESGTRPVALVVFAGEAYLVGGPTDDPRALDGVVGVMDAETMPDRGSRPDRALRLARDALQGASARGAHVVLISDGGGAGPEALREARLLRESGAAVSAVFLAPSETRYGMPPPRSDALEDLAFEGGGAVVDAARLDPLIARLNADAGSAIRDARFAALLFRDHGRLLLLLALPPALWLCRRRRAP